LSPALRFIPSLIGLGIAKPTEVPHLTSVPSNSTDVTTFLFTLYINVDIDLDIDLNIDVVLNISDGIELFYRRNGN
jgi:hypothetical protein